MIGIITFTAGLSCGFSAARKEICCNDNAKHMRLVWEFLGINMVTESSYHKLYVNYLRA